jgi:hypothetical protein
MSAYFNAPLRVPSGATLDVIGTTLLKGTSNVTGTLDVMSTANFNIYGVGSNALTLKSAADGSSFTLTLPSSVGAANQVLTTDGSTGALSWTTPSASGTVYSNAIAESNEGNILFSTLAGSANISVDTANTIVFNAGTANVTVSQSAVNVYQSTDSTDTATGALIIAGGAGIGGNVNVGLSANVGLNLDVVGNVNILSTEGTTYPNTGALIVSGGAGFGGNIHVGGESYVQGNLIVFSGVDSSDQFTGALIVGGGAGFAGNLYADTINSVSNVVVGSELFVTGNGIFDGRFIQSVDEITTESSNAAAATNIWTGGYKTVKHLVPTTLNDTYYEALGGDIVNGQMLHLFYTSNITNNSRVDFGASGVYTGGGAAQYLTFTNVGQSATLIYLQSTLGNGWRIINSGAQVS